MTEDDRRKIHLRIAELRDEIEELESQVWRPTDEELKVDRERQRKYQESLNKFSGMDNDTLAVEAIALYPGEYIEALKVIRDVSKLGLKESKELMDKHLGRR